MDPLNYLIAALGFVFVVWLAIKARQNLLEIVYLLFFFLPFEWTPTVDLAGFTFKINHLIGIILIVFWLAKVIKLRKVAPNPYLAYYLCLIGAILVSVSSAVFAGKAVIGFALVVFAVALAVIIYDLVKTNQDLEKINRYIYFSAWVVVIFAIWQFLGDFIGLPHFLTGLREGYTKATFGFPRVQAFSREPLYLGSFLFIPLGLISGKILKGGSNFSDKLLLFLLVTIMFLTLSRGAILGLAVAVFVLLCIFPRRLINLRNMSYVLSAMLVTAGIIFAGLSLYGGDKVERFVDHLTIKDISNGESTVSRLLNYRSAIEISQSAPYFGVGIGNYGGATANYDPLDQRVNNIVNNEYLEMLVETGYVGLLALIALIVFAIARSVIVIRKSKSQEKFVLGALTATFVGMMFQYNFFSTLSIIHIWAMFALLSIYQKINE